MPIGSEHYPLTLSCIISFTLRDPLFNCLLCFTQEITGGKGVDVAVEALGKPQTFAQCTQSVKDGGKAVMIGLAKAGSLGQMDINRLVRRKVCTLSLNCLLWLYRINVCFVQDFGSPFSKLSFRLILPLAKPKLGF